MTADQFVKALKGADLKVKEHSGWRTHNRNHKGAWGPVNGVVIHHTAGADSLNFVFNGSADLPGPLCHSHLAKDGTVTMIGNGRTNHAGTFAANAFSAMVNESATHPRPDSAEPVDANVHTYGIEIENKGDGKDPYPAAQYKAAVGWAAAICHFHGWSANSVIGHKEGTRRKIDPSFSMNEFRKDVTALLDEWKAPSKPSTPSKPSKPTPSKPKPPAFPGAVYFRSGAKNKYVTQLGEALVKKGFGRFYKQGPGPTWTAVDKAATKAFQQAQGWKGSDADGYPGVETWKRLFS
ncbi:peptidoglycan-binding protein [Streptomyces sp. NPDC056638]|uniref:peptidoglycan-binding protein n=1 Tax=Streptomyces sp. NPDC056638 TaxID=3345887 RepID=UPI0036AA8A3B